MPEISRQENFSNRVAQRKEEAKAKAELKGAGLLPDIIALPYKDTEVSSPENQLTKEKAQPDQKEAEILSTANEPAKEENGQSWGAWGKAKLVAGIAGATGICGAALYYAAPYIPTILEGVVASSIGNGTSVNSTYLG